jgi:hypothetical protein
MNCKIESDKETLNKLNKEVGWIPDFDSIRPIEEILNKKYEDIKNINKFYISLRDYILDIIFEFKTEINSDGKIYVNNTSFLNKLVKNEYPYQCPKGTEHYILWYNSKLKCKNDEDITEDIKEEIKNIFNVNKEFVWYENPKMTIKELYHVQVFIKE